MQLFSARRSVPAAFVVWLVAGLCPAPAAAQTPAVERVRLPFPAYDGTLTPYTFELGYPLVTLVYDTLLWRDAEGVPRPWLARSVSRSDGGRRLTVRLRDGVRWHDGRPLTAADVAFTFRFAAERYHPRFTPALRDVRRVRAPGPLTVTIDLRRPSLGFDDQPLADLPILPRHRWQQLPAGRLAPRGLPVGSGPYRLVRAQPDEGYAFRANRGHFLGAPRVREISVPIIRDAQRTYEALRERRVDMVPLGLPGAAAREFDSMIGIALRRGPSYTGTAVFFNLRRPPFDRVAARRAVAAALDLGRIARNVAPAVAADEGFIHPQSRWSPGRRLHRFAPREGSAARATLGPSVVRVLAPAHDPVRLEAGRQVVLALRRAGARATLVRRSREQFERALGVDGSTPDFEAAITGTPALVSYDPAYLTRLFGADPRTAPLNVGGYRSEQFEALARRVASAPDPQARWRATLAELELIGRDVPAVALFFPRGTYAFRPAIYDDWVFVKGTGILDKRSFTPRTTPAGAQPEGPAAGARPPDSASGWSPGLLDVISLAVLAVVVALAATALLLRRRDRRARGF